VASSAKPVFSVQVRELIEFAWRSGDLGGDRQFVGRERGLAGTRGHRKIQRSRPAGYQKEVPVSYELEADALVLRIQGRLDGLWVSPSEAIIEEIKTVQGPWDHRADPLHWAQAKIYGYICTQDHSWNQVTLQLTYLDLETGEVTEFREPWAEPALTQFFQATTAIYLDWITQQQRWRRLRDESIRALNFPFSDYRPGQRQLAVAVYRTLARGGCLFVEAPTGIGKTVAIIFPALKAIAEGKLDRIFYLTARTVGRMVAEHTFARLRQNGLRLLVLTLTAKEKICRRQGQSCDQLNCALAIGYYDRVKVAMRAALNRENLTREVIEDIAQVHQVCPFELSLDLSEWVEAVICDYNYVFDPQVYLRRHFDEPKENYALLVDEAHNLVDRAREMFSAELDNREIHEVRCALKEAVPRCARALSRLSAALRKMGGSLGSSSILAETREAVGEMDLFSQENIPDEQGAKPPNKGDGLTFKAGRDGILTTPQLPEHLIPLIEKALQEAEVWLVKNQPAEFRQSLLELFFRLQAFLRVAELFDTSYVTLHESISGRAALLRLFCLDPSQWLRQTWQRGQATVFFSATLTPIDYYRVLLGGSEADPWLQLPSPFPPEHLAALVQGRIRTHLRARAETLDEVVQAIITLVQCRRGNYLVYLPSYPYLCLVQEHFHRLRPELPVLAQRPGMTESEREDFLAAFNTDHQDTLVGFAVMGGIFGEGIDLVGDRLIGAIMVGVGLPQLCVERDLISEYFEAKTGAGFDYAYRFPGMNRVLQAAGRVIRSETDRGVVLLIDTRFLEPGYRRLFPAWWQVQWINQAAELQAAGCRFWSGLGP
jgi:DNA excision repair protein ERCC-2